MATKFYLQICNLEKVYSILGIYFFCKKKQMKFHKNNEVTTIDFYDKNQFLLSVIDFVKEKINSCSLFYVISNLVIHHLSRVIYSIVFFSSQNEKSKRDSSENKN